MQTPWGTEHSVACADVVVIVSYVDYVLCPHMLFSHLNVLCLTYAFFFCLIDAFHSLATDFDRESPTAHIHHYTVESARKHISKTHALTMADCTGFSSASTCMGSNVDKPTPGCVWQSSSCLVDPCTPKFSDWDSCVADSACVGIRLQGSNNNQCLSIQRVCSYLNSDACQTYPWCLKSATGDSCMYYVPGQGVDGSTSESCLSFPLWSIALIVLWILVMVILGGVVVLAIRQRRLDLITEVEESEVHVDNVAVSHQDNFAPRNDLERRLNDDDY
jgi:hypothetical protein